MCMCDNIVDIGMHIKRILNLIRMYVYMYICIQYIKSSFVSFIVNNIHVFCFSYVSCFFFVSFFARIFIKLYGRKRDGLHI